MEDKPDDIWSKYPEQPPRREWLTPNVLASLGVIFVILTVMVKCRELIHDLLWMSNQ